ncbi:MAG: type II restriction endonuclease [Prevotellaceae bacterium]|jgi:type II restriction enzyme|nr:type II restriction endonuclease [Prevotellaceae bacterium]
MEKNFSIFMNQLAETNATLDFYTDFSKIRENVRSMEIKLNTLNYLIGKQDLESAVKELWDNDKRVFSILDILIATRKEQNKKYLDDMGKPHLIHELLNSYEGIMKFLNETGLADVLKDKNIKNLVDYVFGVEAGLDTHARKNRSGDITELLLHRILTANGVEHRMEVYSHEFPELQKALGADEKRFDFMIKTKQCTYLIEVNFYNGGGSKPNEVARAYRELSPIVNKVDGFEFVWVTDGQGWNSARNKLEEAYNEIDRMYNFESLGNFIEEIKAEL